MSHPIAKISICFLLSFSHEQLLADALASDPERALAFFQTGVIKTDYKFILITLTKDDGTCSYCDILKKYGKGDRYLELMSRYQCIPVQVLNDLWSVRELFGMVGDTLPLVALFPNPRDSRGNNFTWYRQYKIYDFPHQVLSSKDDSFVTALELWMSSYTNTFKFADRKYTLWTQANRPTYYDKFYSIFNDPNWVLSINSKDCKAVLYDSGVFWSMFPAYWLFETEPITMINPDEREAWRNEHTVKFIKDGPGYFANTRIVHDTMWDTEQFIADYESSAKFSSDAVSSISLADGTTNQVAATDNLTNIIFKCAYSTKVTEGSKISLKYDIERFRSDSTKVISIVKDGILCSQIDAGDELHASGTNYIDTEILDGYNFERTNTYSIVAVGANIGNFSVAITDTLIKEIPSFVKSTEGGDWFLDYDDMFDCMARGDSASCTMAAPSNCTLAIHHLRNTGSEVTTNGVLAGYASPSLSIAVRTNDVIKIKSPTTSKFDVFSFGN